MRCTHNLTKTIFTCISINFTIHATYIHADIHTQSIATGMHGLPSPVKRPVQRGKSRVGPEPRQSGYTGRQQFVERLIHTLTDCTTLGPRPWLCQPPSERRFDVMTMISIVMMMSNVIKNNYAWSVTCLLLETNFISSVDEKHPDAITPFRRWCKTSKGHTFYVVDVKHPKAIPSMSLM